MTTYEAVSGAALASLPGTEPAPPIVAADAGPGGEDPTDPLEEANFWFWFWNIVFWSNVLHLITIAVRIPIFLPLFISAINDFIASMQPQSEPAPEASEPQPTPAPALGAVAHRAPVAADRPDLMGYGLASPIAGAAAGAPASPATPATSGPALPVGGAEISGYLVFGGYAEDSGPTLIDRDQATAPAAGVSAATAAKAPSVRAPLRARRRRRVAMAEYADATMALDAQSTQPPVGPASAASETGAGPLGFTGTARRGDARSTGLVRLGDDAFGAAPVLPLLPESWDRPENMVTD
jgi:hypothetical protein